jgi:phosphoenolpyruvate---glycerone phosphotransferase subunit DhaL
VRFKPVLTKIDAICARPINDALSEVGNTLILSVGGASGPLYGKVFATIGQHVTNNPGELSKERIVSACEQAIRVIKTLGRSDVGHKIMLDVLVPSLDQLRAADGAG